MSTPRTLQVETAVVYGPIALHARRLDAAEAGKLGIQAVTMEQLAASLAGGFLRPASSSDLDVAVRSALDEGGFQDLQGLAGFPGAIRAVSRSLRRVWEADLPLAVLAAGSLRMADLALIDQRVRAALPCGSLATPDLVQAALKRVHLAGKLLGPVELANLPCIAPVWRALVRMLGLHTQVRWSGPLPWGSEELPGKRKIEKARALPTADVVACADPRSEALEALRWMRRLLANGLARPRDIAIAAADPGTWDAAMLAARAETRLPLHFSHGIPALETRHGQACATLANLLQHGLSQERVRRVLAHCAAVAPGLARLPSKALFGVARDAALTEIAHWRAALTAALPAREDGQDPAPLLLPLLEMAEKGLAAADEAGRLFLPTGAQELWADALRRAPCHALPITLEALRAADARNPGDSVTWGPASHLAAAPRPFVRLLGLNARAWPRQSSDDPILPAHIMDASLFGKPTITAEDRAAFMAIRDGANGALTLSRSRRNGRGSILPPSPLLPPDMPERTLARHRIPEHAAGPADRLLARPADADADEHVAAAAACVAGRSSRRLNAHDGLLPADHPLIRQALRREQSATSLRLLLRDPQGYVWRQVLHWSSPSRTAGQLALDPRAHGELVHEILKGAVEELEEGPGFGSASVPQVRQAIATAASRVLQSWPPRRPTPPHLLWVYAVDLAAAQATRALVRDMPLQPSTRSYTEIAFGGGQEGEAGRKRPWSSGVPVSIPGTELRFGGSIDRLDVRGDGPIQVTDYKTGDVPKHHGSMVLDGGRELQRVLYALAARTLLSDVTSTRARLAFLREDPALMAVLVGVDDAIASASRHLAAAAGSLSQGISLPGPDAEDKWADGRVALPATGSGYFGLKRSAFLEAFGDVRQAWSAR